MYVVDGSKILDQDKPGWMKQIIRGKEYLKTYPEKYGMSNFYEVVPQTANAVKEE